MVETSPAPLFSSISNEWYTPSIYIQAALEVMGRIDLDPASCPFANQVVGAETFYTIEQDGLSLPFYGCIWLNPPYGKIKGKSNTGLWVDRVVNGYKMGQVEQAILLVNANTDTYWFQSLWDYLICFTRGRINFYTDHPEIRDRNTHGSALIYLGPHEDRFISAFSRFGPIMKKIA